MQKPPAGAAGFAAGAGAGAAGFAAGAGAGAAGFAAGAGAGAAGFAAGAGAGAAGFAAALSFFPGFFPSVFLRRSLEIAKIIRDSTTRITAASVTHR